MKSCSVVLMTAPSGLEHFGIIETDKPGWPLALCGPSKGPSAKEGLKEAELFAAAPDMLNLLSLFSRELGNIGSSGLSESKRKKLSLLAESATRFVKKHK